MDETNKPNEQQAVKKPGIFGKLIEKLKQYKRVLSVAHKPDKEELTSSMKITGSGIVLLGAVGFIIFLLYFLIIQLGTTGL
jgi:protein translocase SEC61 complex gamma subunit